LIVGTVLYPKMGFNGVDVVIERIKYDPFPFCSAGNGGKSDRNARWGL
jgi:hypothetical protein